MPTCNGICVMGSELIEGARGVAYPHPECELHSGYVEPEQCEHGDERNRQCLQVTGHEPPCTFGPWPIHPVGDSPTHWQAILTDCDDDPHVEPCQCPIGHDHG